MSRDSPGTPRAERLHALVLKETRDTDQMRMCLEEAGVLSAINASPETVEGPADGHCRRACFSDR